MSSPDEIQTTHPGLEALEDGFCMLDSGWRVVYWNAAAERMLRTPRGAILGRSLWEAMPFLRSSASWESLHQVVLQGAPHRYLETNPPGHGRGYTSVYAAPLADGGLSIHFRDATEDVRRAEQYAGLLESIHDGFIAVDEKWNLVYLNATAESLLRFSRDKALGVSLWSVLPRGPIEIGECLRATMADGIERHLREVRPEGRVFRGRVFDLWTYPLGSGGISVLFEDVSERVKRESELARFAVEADEANQSKSRFFAAVSHELRTPLNAIVGYTHLLNSQTYGPMPDGARRAADRAGVCAEHLARLVDDVLLLTTAEIGHIPICPAPVELQDYLPTILEPLRHQAEAKGLAFSIEVPPDLPAVQTDQQRLRQLLVALLSNAVKFTSTGSVRVHTAIYQETADAERASYDLFPEPEIEIAVIDTGPGIEPENRERIFGAFERLGDPSRTQSMTRGTGLSLTIARELAQLLGGQLYLTDTSPAGSTFCVRLPLAHKRVADSR